MKIYIPTFHYEGRPAIGGGFRFVQNLTKGMRGKAEIVNTWQECDIYLIAGATIAERSEVEEAKKAGKKIVLRIDNMPRDSRNRGTAFSRMRDFATMADWIVFQSEWARDYVGWWLKEKLEVSAMDWNFVGTLSDFTDSIDENGKKCSVAYAPTRENNSIIYNGVDSDYFYKDDKDRYDKNYLVIQYNRDENKRTSEAFYDFAMRSREDQDVRLKIVGKFSPELIKYNFDFFDDENIIYIGIVEEPDVMGRIMRSCKYFYWPAFADACPNTLLEAVACGCEPLLLNDTGGSNEAIKNITTIQEMADKYLEIFKNLWGN